METKERTRWIIPFAVILCLCAACVLIFLWRYMSRAERTLRRNVVENAETYLGCNETDGSHHPIVDLYNAQEPRPRDYAVTYEDSWCAAFVSAVAMQSKMSDWIPMECSCEQMIALFDQVGEWEESDWYLPQTGDIIFYDWDGRWIGDNKGWSDHIGIVVAVYGPVIKVIEGNYKDAVGYHYVFINHPHIRGYGLPDYRKCAATS